MAFRGSVQFVRVSLRSSPFDIPSSGSPANIVVCIKTPTSRCIHEIVDEHANFQPKSQKSATKHIKHSRLLSGFFLFFAWFDGGRLVAFMMHYRHLMGWSAGGWSTLLPLRVGNNKQKHTAKVIFSINPGSLNQGVRMLFLQCTINS